MNGSLLDLPAGSWAIKNQKLQFVLLEWKSRLSWRSVKILGEGMNWHGNDQQRFLPLSWHSWRFHCPGLWFSASVTVAEGYLRAPDSLKADRFPVRVPLYPRMHWKPLMLPFPSAPSQKHLFPCMWKGSESKLCCVTVSVSTCWLTASRVQSSAWGQVCCVSEQVSQSRKVLLSLSDAWQ